MTYRHKKTRKQKIAADMRQGVYTLKTDLAAVPETTTTIAVSKKDFDLNSLVLRDVTKTSIITLAILALEILLFFLIKNHIISIPGINY